VTGLEGAHEQAGLLAVFGGEAALVVETASRDLEGLFVDDGRDCDGDPLFLGAVSNLAW